MVLIIQKEKSHNNDIVTSSTLFVKNYMIINLANWISLNLHYHSIVKLFTSSTRTHNMYIYTYIVELKSSWNLSKKRTIFLIIHIFIGIKSIRSLFSVGLIVKTTLVSRLPLSCLREINYVHFLKCRSFNNGPIGIKFCFKLRNTAAKTTNI